MQIFLLFSLALCAYGVSAVDNQSHVKNILLDKGEANRFLNRERRGLRGGLYNECCRGGTSCSFEERAEFSEDHGWSRVDSELCHLSFFDYHNCRCRSRGGSYYKCGSHTSACRNRVCSCSSSNTKGWKFVSIHYDVPKGTVRQKLVQAARHSINNLGHYGTNTLPSTSFSVQVSESSTRSFQYSHGKTFEIGASFEAGVPEVAKATISTRLSFSETYTYGRSKTTTKTVTNSFTCPARENKFSECTATVTESHVDVPYTMTMRHEYYGCYCTNAGIYKQVSKSGLHMVPKYYDHVPAHHG